MVEQKKKGRFKPDFKDGAVQMVANGKSAAMVARELGLPEWQVQTWVRESKKKKNNPLDQSLIEENKRLKKELARLQEEAEILKKAAAYFARHQQ
jgi:transposase